MVPLCTVLRMITITITVVAAVVNAVYLDAVLVHHGPALPVHHHHLDEVDDQRPGKRLDARNGR